MEFNELVSIIVNNGASLGCLIYFMYAQNTTQKELKYTIDELKLLIQKLIDKLEKEGH